MNIVLTGFMGTGKTAVAKELARLLNWPVIDTDAEIEKKTGKKITEIFAENGEEYFRQIEAEVIQKLTQLDRQIIAVGGGAVIRAENRQNLARNGIIINLVASPEVIFERLKKDTSRPLLNQPEREKIIRKLLPEREKFYCLCNLRINTDNLTPKEIAEKIILRVKKHEKSVGQSQPDLPGNNQ